jgi:N-dimethylarginine dimethylaminohydrolase
MAYNVHQPWDSLKVCVVGKSYSPEFYEFMENTRLKTLFQRIARETEEDYQVIIQKLKEFDVDVVRPDVPDVQVDQYLFENKRIPGPISMIPRDQMCMIGEKFYVFPYESAAAKSSGRIVFDDNWSEDMYNKLRGSNWPEEFTAFNDLSDNIKKELRDKFEFVYTAGEDPAFIKTGDKFPWWAPIVEKVKQAGNTIIYNKDHNILDHIPANGITVCGKDLLFGCSPNILTEYDNIKRMSGIFFKDYRCHYVTTGGHIDGCFTPIKPGLIVSIENMETYANTFPGWEVVYLQGESWGKVEDFLQLKKKNQGRWWIQGHEYDNELIDYVETWLGDWVGYCEESVFDVNILVIDEKNIIVSGYNEQAFEAFARHGVTAHICPFRHRYFWDGGIHCVTLDLHREGTQQDYFPERR